MSISLLDCNKCNSDIDKMHVEVFNNRPSYKQFSALFLNIKWCKTFVKNYKQFDKTSLQCFLPVNTPFKNISVNFIVPERISLTKN